MCFVSLLVLSTILSLDSVSYGLEIGAFTIFGCDAEGTQDGYARWNTGPVDACWDMFVYVGELVQRGKEPEWLNDPKTHLVRLVPGRGSTTFTFHFDCGADVNMFGLNLFAQGQNEPVVSVYAPVTQDMSRPMQFKVNHSSNTMGWPLSVVAGAGTLSNSEANSSLWIHEIVEPEKKYTIVDFKILTPEAAGNLDLVGPGKTEPSGQPDWVGQFTIKTEELASAPANWLLWISTIAGMKIGPNNQNGTWEQEYDSAGAMPPFSFVYGGRSSNKLLKDWQFEAEHKKLDENRISHELAWLDPQTGLEVCWKGLEFTDFESIEWTIYIRNTGTAETPIIENIKALNVDLRRGQDRQYVLRHWKGTLVKAEDLAPSNTVLEAGQELTFRPNGTRLTGTAGEWPYYNLDAGSEGIILVIGWPGR